MIHQFFDFLKTLTDPQRLAALLSGQFAGWIGYGLLALIIFSETGLLAGFFLPGDSLLFTVGVVCGFGYLKMPLIILLLSCAAMIGDNVGYLLGRSAGPHVFSRPKSRFFNPEHVHRAKLFYEKHGGRAIVYARFVPVIRTAMPFMAGVAEMPYHRFLTFSIFSGVGWIAAMSFLGFKLGGVPVIQKNIEFVVIGIALVSLIPVLMQLLRRRSTSVA